MAMYVSPEVATAIADGRVPDGVTAAWLMQSRDNQNIAAIYAVLGLTALVILLRVYSRFFVVKKPGLDDALAIGSMMLYIAFAALSIKLIKIGSGRHFEYIEYVMASYYVYLGETLDFVAHLVYTAALFCCRMSGLVFYWYICRQHSVASKLIIGTAVFLVLAVLTQMLLIILHCIPVTSLWPYSFQPEVNDFTCIQWGAVYSVNSALSLVSDVLLATIPAWIIKSLQMSAKKKLRLAIVLLVGLPVICVSIARLYLVAVGQWEADESWSYDILLSIENAEIGTTVIALSIPALKPLLGSWATWFNVRSTTAGSTDGGLGWRMHSVGKSRQGMPEAISSTKGLSEFAMIPEQRDSDDSLLRQGIPHAR